MEVYKISIDKNVSIPVYDDLSSMKHTYNIRNSGDEKYVLEDLNTNEGIELYSKITKKTIITKKINIYWNTSTSTPYIEAYPGWWLKNLFEQIFSKLIGNIFSNIEEFKNGELNDYKLYECEFTYCKEDLTNNSLQSSDNIITKSIHTYNNGMKEDITTGANNLPFRIVINKTYISIKYKDNDNIYFQLSDNNLFNSMAYEESESEKHQYIYFEFYYDNNTKITKFDKNNCNLFIKTETKKEVASNGRLANPTSNNSSSSSDWRGRNSSASSSATTTPTTTTVVYYNKISNESILMTNDELQAFKNDPENSNFIKYTINYNVDSLLSSNTFPASRVIMTYTAINNKIDKNRFSYILPYTLPCKVLTPVADYCSISFKTLSSYNIQDRGIIFHEVSTKNGKLYGKINCNIDGFLLKNKDGDLVIFNQYHEEKTPTGGGGGGF